MVKGRWAAFFCLYFTAVLLLAGCADSRSITIMYSASLSGSADGCLCGEKRDGGLVKRAYYLKQLDALPGTLLVDAGDILESFPDKTLAELILLTYVELGYQAVAVGANELAQGRDLLVELMGQYPLVTANIEIDGAANSPATVVVDRNSVRIGIFSLLDQSSFDQHSYDLDPYFEILPLQESAEKAIEILRQNSVDLTILLFHGLLDSAEKLIGQVPGIDIAVLGHEGRLIDAERVGKTLIVSSGRFASSIGSLEIELRGKKISVKSNEVTSFDFTEDRDDPAVRERIDLYMSQMKLGANRSELGGTP